MDAEFLELVVWPLRFFALAHLAVSVSPKTAFYAQLTSDIFVPHAPSLFAIIEL